MNTSKLLLVMGIAGAISFHSTTSEAKDQRPPNIVVIMADDLGYSDLGCYGGEIDTPHLDSLAANGLRFSQFYNTAKCHSSRVSLLTGQYCIAAGDVSLSHAVTSAEVLRDAGYFTAMTGKWHLDREPTDFGFDRYFGHLSGACNFFKGDNSFRLNGEKWSVPAVLNDKTFYTTVADVDFALDFLTEARRRRNRSISMLPLMPLMLLFMRFLKIMPSTRVGTPKAGMRYVTPASKNRFGWGFFLIRSRPAHARLISGRGKMSFPGSDRMKQTAWLRSLP